MTVGKHEAVKSLCPNAKWYIDEYDNLNWLSDDIAEPTDAEITSEIQRLTEIKPIQEARAKRDRLLTDSDWVTIRATDTGNPVPTEWQTYRQALRDITEQTGFPEDIEWPEKPES